MALLYEGKMTKGMLGPDQTPALLMLQNKYKSGVVVVPCDKASNGTKMETVEILSLVTKTKPVVKNGSAVIDVKTERLTGSAYR